MNDQTYTILLSDILVIGINEALIFRRIKELLADESVKKITFEGRKYVPLSYDELKENHFPFWCTATIRRTLLSLQSLKLIEGKQFGGMNRTMYYTTTT